MGRVLMSFQHKATLHGATSTGPSSHHVLRDSNSCLIDPCDSIVERMCSTMLMIICAALHRAVRQLSSGPVSQSWPPS
jgi:hypothetical protein